MKNSERAAIYDEVAGMLREHFGMAQAPDLVAAQAKLIRNTREGKSHGEHLYDMVRALENTDKPEFQFINPRKRYHWRYIAKILRDLPPESE